uniref:EF-hand domain-containing protein n=1 Tax=Ciona savignyi TaxID=51511 RepID=H2ZEF2_CIOSA
RFHFPHGQPRPTGSHLTSIEGINRAFNKLKNEKLTRQELALIAKELGLGSYWKSALYKAACQPNASLVSKSDVIAMWERIAAKHHDNPSRFVAMLAKPDRSSLDFDDFLCVLQDVVECHPGLVFLRDAPEFHTRYMNTVIARIFYTVNRSWSGCITVPELRRCNFLQTLGMLEDEDDINMICDFFSYEHYVIYCKFWELDTDHDLVIDKMDLSRHANGALSNRLIDRVLSGAVTRWDTSDHRLHKMSYVDFVWFLISEEDKKSSTSIEYWFRCMDVDGDGVISMYEMEFFYEDQMRKLEQLDIEPLPFEDCVCQMLDMVKPANRDHVTLNDLKRCKMAHVFFDTFFNVEKYLDNEQKDPFAPQKNEPTDWERFAAEEYELLVAEEQANDHQIFDSHRSYDDDIDPLLEDELRNLGINHE